MGPDNIGCIVVIMACSVWGLDNIGCNVIRACSVWGLDNIGCTVVIMACSVWALTT